MHHWVTLIWLVMKVVKTLTGYCQCNKVCGSPLTYAGEGSHVVAEPDDDNLDDDDNDDDDILVNQRH